MKSKYDTMGVEDKARIWNIMDGLIDMLVAFGPTKEQLAELWDEVVMGSTPGYTPAQKVFALKRMAEVLEARCLASEYYELCVILRDYNYEILKKAEDECSNNSEG